MEISIIIPVYNTAPYLEECLDSVLAQQFEDWECLLIDDGSTDNSSEVCDLYARRDKRFRVFHIVNSGVSFARNLGIQHASGKYIAFIDSDDLIDNFYLSALHKAATQAKSELVVCGMKLLCPSGTEVLTAADGLVIIGKEDSERFTELNSKYLLYGPVVKLYRADVVKGHGISFPLGIQYGEDLIFNLQYLEYVTHIQVVNSVGYNYRILSEGSLSSGAHSRSFENNYGQWKMIRSFFEKRGINDSHSRIFLSNRLWGIAYNMAMSNRLSMNEIRNTFSTECVADLKTFDEYTIAVPCWLKIMIMNRLYRLIWLVQRR